MTDSPASVPASSFRFSVALGDRVLLGALAALVVARPLVFGDDPGRLRLTTSAGPVWFNLGVWLLMLGVAAWRVVVARNWKGEGLLLLALLAVVFVPWNSDQESYRRPGGYVRWELAVLIPAFFVTRQLAFSAADRRGVVNVLLASAVSVAAIGLVQRFGHALGVPSTEPVITDVYPGLVGDDEFQASLNAPATATGLVHGTLESPEAYLVFLLAALPLAILIARRPGARAKVLLPVVVVAGVLAVFAGTIFTNHVPTSLSEGLRIFQSHPLTGCGGGNFSRVAGDGILASGSGWLTFMATQGLIPCLAFGLLTGAFLIRMIRPSGQLASDSSPETLEPVLPGTRWEFYLGGIAGLLAGFVGAAGQMPAETPVWEVYKVGGFAVGRGVVWLAAFGILERLRPSAHQLRIGLSLGVAVIFIAGFFTEAVLSPAILFPAVVMLAMTGTAPPAQGDLVERPWTRPVAVAAAVLTVSVLVYYVIVSAGPAWQTADAVRKARMASRYYPDVERQIELAKNNIERANARTRAINFLNAQILNPLRSAAEKDPNNAPLLLEIARWERPLWRQELHADPREAARLGRDILRTADKAAKLDPRNIAGEQAILEALFLYRKESNTKPAERLEAFNNHLDIIARRMPQLEVPYRYRMVSALLDAGDADGVEPEIAKLLRLNRVEGRPHGAMTDNQRQDVVERSRKVIVKPPQELIDEWNR